MTTTGHVISSTTPVSPVISSAPNIKRHVQLYRYGKSGLLGKKCWKESNVIIYDDSTFKIFKDAEGHKTSVKPLKLEDVILDVAFGKAALKYGSPPITPDEHNYISPNNFIAIPETKERNKIHWFAAKDEHNLHEVMRTVAETVAGKMRPPQLGKGPKHRYHEQQTESERWLAYWEAQHASVDIPTEENGANTTVTITTTEQHLQPHPQQPQLHQQSTGAQPVLIPMQQNSPIVDKEEKKAKEKAEKKKEKGLKSKSKHPTTPGIAVMEMPTRVESLRLQPDYGLREEILSDEIPVVRLVGGKRVKENIKRSVFQQSHAHAHTSTHHPHHHHHSSGSGTGIQAAPTPIHHIQADQKNGSAPYKIQVSNYKVEEKPEIVPTNVKRHETGPRVETPPIATTNVAIAAAAPVKEHFSKQHETEEIIGDNQKTVINVGQTEKITSKVENADDGSVTYSTTKQTSYHRSTVTTSND